MLAKTSILIFLFKALIINLFSNLSLGECQVFYPPLWVTSNFIKSDSQRVINGKPIGRTTGNTSTPTATMPFSSPAFTIVPHICYGISSYEGH